MFKNCKNCNQNFEITDDDLKFYGKVSPEFAGKKYLMPTPSFCPQCRVMRRMAFRNDRSLYQRKCDKSGETFVSLYPPNSPFTIYKASQWYKDDFDPCDYGQDFDFSKPFFQQFAELMLKVPRLGMTTVNIENSDYCPYSSDAKNCYLDIAAEGNEDCYYNLFVKYSKNIMDSTFVYNSELNYECINSYNIYNCKYGIYLDNCNDCLFCFDLKGSNNCLFSNNLRQKEYYIFNKPYSKESYEQKLKELNSASYQDLQKNIELWKENMKKAIHRDVYTLNSENCDGNDVKNSKNCHSVFNVVDCEDSKYLYDVLEAKDCMDMNYSLYKPELTYEAISSLNQKNSAFVMNISIYNNDIFYCDACQHSSNLFGCISLRRKEYCILNKQYSKEDYDILVPKIIEYMISTGEWGEFFPASISPHGYNETVVNEYFPLSKKEALAKGFNWSDFEPEFPKVEKIIPANLLPDKISEIPDDILNWAVECESAKKPFKIIKPELDFYRKMNLPIPHLHPDERHKQRMQKRNPRKLYDRNCMKCNVEIKTTYSPERPEIVYCEDCYLKNIY